MSFQSTSATVFAAVASSGSPGGTTNAGIAMRCACGVNGIVTLTWLDCGTGSTGAVVDNDEGVAASIAAAPRQKTQANRAVIRGSYFIPNGFPSISDERRANPACDRGERLARLLLQYTAGSCSKRSQRGTIWNLLPDCSRRTPGKRCSSF